MNSINYQCNSIFSQIELNMNNNRFWLPISCRENEIATINDFIEQFFSKKKSMLMIITGNKSTGKTISVLHCYRMSIYKKQIRFVDCDHYSPIQNLNNSQERMIILDNLKNANEIDKIINFYRDLNVGIICISRKHMSFDFLPKDYSISAINYGMYSVEQLIVILREYLICSQFKNNNSLPESVLEDITNHVRAKNLTAFETLKLLFEYFKCDLFGDHKNKMNIY